MTRRSSTSTVSTNSTPNGFSEQAFWKKIAKLPARVSSRLIYEALILYCILTDRSTPAWVRALIAAALIYLINPLDALPDTLPGVGLADDAAVIAMLLQRLAAYVTPAIESRAKKLVPWGNKTSGDATAPPINNTKPRNRKGTQRETL